MPSFKSNVKAGRGNPNVIRLSDGESIQGLLMGDTYEWSRVFRAGEKPKFKFRVNIITKINGQMDSRIVEGGPKLYEQLQALSESGWNLEETFVQIKRTGSGQMDTVYTASVLPAKPTPEAIAAAKKIQLKNLEEGTGSAPQQPKQVPGEDECPF